MISLGPLSSCQSTVTRRDWNGAFAGEVQTEGKQVGISGIK